VGICAGVRGIGVGSGDLRGMTSGVVVGFGVGLGGEGGSTSSSCGVGLGVARGAGVGVGAALGFGRGVADGLGRGTGRMSSRALKKSFLFSSSVSCPPSGGRSAESEANKVETKISLFHIFPRTLTDEWSCSSRCRLKCARSHVQWTGMKKILSLLLLAFSSLEAQQGEIQAEAVRAFQAGDYRTARSLFESLVSMDPRNAAARNYLRVIAHREKSASTLEETLKRIIIPRMDLRDTTVPEAVSFVSQKVHELSAGKHSLNVVWMLSPEQAAETRVTLSLRNVPASEVLRYIGEASNLQFNYEALAVKVKPMSNPAGEKLAK
jgi:hypothetical protein